MKKQCFLFYMFFVLILVNSANFVNGGMQIASKTKVFDFSTSPETNELKYRLSTDECVVISDIIKSDLPFTDVGVHWIVDSPSKTKVLIKVRTSKDRKSWTKWKRVLIESYPDENPKGEFFSYLIGVDQKDRVHEYIQYRVKLIPAGKKDNPLLKKISFTFIDSGITPTNLTNDIINNQKDGNSIQGSSIYSKPVVVSRNGWEADESLMTWTPEYEVVTHNIIHHTDTPNTDTDWKARIRSIYYYHAVTRGWGDIGYNYLIDPDGVIYEGRYGGDDVIGAHAYGYNNGSMGVAFLGSYGGGSYSGNTTPFDTMLTSAEHLLAWKCGQKNIDPLGSGVDNDGDVYSYISGHRDVGSTTCPGDNLYKLLPTIRKNVNNLTTISTPGIVPQIDNLSSMLGPPGTDVTITGANFGDEQGSGMVNFGSVSAGITSWGDTEIQVTVPSISAGSYDVFVTTANGTSNSISFLITETQAGSDFSIKVVPSQQKVVQGSSATYSVLVNSTDGFNQSVTLTAEGLPNGASAEFSPNPVSPGNNSVLTV